MPHRRTRSSINTIQSDEMPFFTTNEAGGPQDAPSNSSPNNNKTPRTALKGSTSSTNTTSTHQSSGDGSDSAEADEADDADVKPFDTAPSSAFKNIKIEDTPDENQDMTKDTGLTSDVDGEESAEEDFDIAEDDDDYAGLDMISISSGDLHVQKGESSFIEQALRGDMEWADELENTDLALPLNIDWNDGSTYQETPRTGLYDDFNTLADVDPTSPLSHVQHNNPFPNAAHMLMYKDADPALRRPLFDKGDADSVDFFDGSTSSSSSSSDNSPRPVTQADDLASQSAETLTVASQDDSDTEDEDISSEMEAHVRRIEQRKKTERRRKQKTAPKTLKLRPKSAETEQRVDVLKNFRINPRKAAAWTQMTPRGSVLRFYEPRGIDKVKIKWVIGRTKPTPVDNTPMSAAYAVAMQSTMFRILHCPNSPSLSFQRDRRAKASHFGSNLMLHSPGLLPIPAHFGNLELEYGEATEDDIADLFLDLDNASEAGDESESASTPGTALPTRVRELDEADESSLETTSVETPTPMPRFDHTGSSGPSSTLDQDMTDAPEIPQTPATPTNRPRKRTLEAIDVDANASSPSKRHRPRSSLSGIAV